MFRGRELADAFLLYIWKKANNEKYLIMFILDPPPMLNVLCLLFQLVLRKLFSENSQKDNFNF